MAQLIRERDEALEREKASAEVLRVISSSPGELEPVFQMMLQNATRICDAMFGAMYLSEGNDVFRIVAMHNAPPAFAEMRWRNPVFRANPRIAIARAAATKQPVQIADAQTEPGYLDPLPGFSGSQIATLAGGRTLLGVPLLKENKLVGAIGIYRQEVLPFTERQIALVQNFAAQAVIAIENTRLLNELRQRTDEFAHSVQGLQALGEVTQAVNSTLDLQTVLSTIVAKAVQLSGTDAGAIYVFEEAQQLFRLRATFGFSEDLITAVEDQHLGASEAIRQVTQDKQPQETSDIGDEPPSSLREIAMQAGYRARLIVPLVSADQVVGALVIRRKQPGEFPKGTIHLLQTFAAQSVLAIQNARLFSEIEEKSRQLAMASEERFRSFVDHAMDAFFLLDEHQALVDVNKQACESLGYSREEMIAMHPRDFDAGLDEASIARIGERVKTGETVTFEFFIGARMEPCSRSRFAPASSSREHARSAYRWRATSPNASARRKCYARVKPSCRRRNG
jgi:GAF domain-containing protein